MTAAKNEAVELTFLGTRGEIRLRSRWHRRHSALLIEYAGARIMIDCGLDWLGRLRHLSPTAIVLTHAHLDHAGGLARGAPCPVYATSETLRRLRRLPISQRCRMPLKKPLTIGGLKFTAYPVQHSLRAPAVGYRVSAKAGAFLYLPDVALLPNAAAVLRGVDVYIGDGATMRRSMVRARHGTLIGHASIATQLDWCAAARLRRAIFTHCGSPIVRGDPAALDAMLGNFGRRYGIDAHFARDGERLFFRGIDVHKKAGAINSRKRCGRSKPSRSSDSKPQEKRLAL